MEQVGGSAKSLGLSENPTNFITEPGKSSHSHNSQGGHNHVNEIGSRSSDNLQEGSKRSSKKFHEDGRDGSDGEITKRGTQMHRTPTSVSASTYVGGTGGPYPVMSSASYPLVTERETAVVNERHSANSGEWNQHHHTGSLYENKISDVTNISSQITISAPDDYGNSLTGIAHSYTPSPRSSPGILASQASGESSDERGDRVDRNRLCASREGSFERSVSFQEGIVDHDKSNELLRSSESNRSLDLSHFSRSADSNQSLRAVDSSSGAVSAPACAKEKDRKESREAKAQDKKSKKAWYNVLSPTYKSRSEDLKRLFKDLPSDERLIVDYSCALQKDILVHGRLYVTPNYFSFYSKIFGWETFLSIRCKDIVAMTKEKTALVIPNALQVNTDTEKHFFTSFAARDKTYLMLFRIWQNALMDQQMSATELWHWVHSSYGEELGLTSDDDDYVAPSTEDDGRGSCGVAPDAATDGAPRSKVAKRASVDSTEDASQGESNAEDTLKQACPNEEKEFTPPCVVAPPAGVIYQVPASVAEKELPTDISDTVESDQEKEKSTGFGGETVVCPSIATHHSGREVSNAVYSLPIDTLFTLLFTNSKFMLDLHTARKTYDVVTSPWQSNPETNQKIRQVTYTLTLPTNSFGPKVSHVTETQVISAFSKPKEIYTIDAEASNSGIPYADSFYVSNHWCLTRESVNETRLALWSQVKYKKNVWGFMKSVIDKNAFSGMESFVSDLNASLLLEVDRTNLRRTKRRRRRAGSKGSDIGDPLLQLPSAGVKSTEIHTATQIPSRMAPPYGVGESSSPGASSSLRPFAVVFLCLLLAVNAFLYHRLYHLEERVVSNVSFKNLAVPPSIFKLSGDEGYMDEWVRILHRQEALHAEELERWRKAVVEAADYLRKAETSLRELHASIPSAQASKMQSLLQQLQLLQQTQARKSPQTPPTPPTSGSRREGERTVEL